LLTGVDNLELRSALRSVVAMALRQNRLHAAAREVDELLRINPEDTDMLRYRGVIFEHHGKSDAAWADYMRAAEGGDAAAQYRVGVRLHKGTQPNVARSEANGLAWVRRAAAQKHEGALRYLEKAGR
jgi:TPR repeat protein